jgi:hypothetical protein
MALALPRRLSFGLSSAILSDTAACSPGGAVHELRVGIELLGQGITRKQNTKMIGLGFSECDVEAAVPRCCRERAGRAPPTRGKGTLPPVWSESYAGAPERLLRFD